MNIDKILILLGEPQSVFLENMFKYFSSSIGKKNKKEIIIIGSLSLIKLHMKKLKYNFKFNLIKDVKFSKINSLNLIDVKFKPKNFNSKISSYSNDYLNKCFKLSLKILKREKNIVLINGPISKKHFLKDKFLGITEYIANYTKSKNEVMIIYNKILSVVPVTTHLPVKDIYKNISKLKIINAINKVNLFYSKNLKKTAQIAVLGLNPHCETRNKINEEKNFIIPAIKYCKRRRIKVDGPFSADTFFLKKNISYYDVVLGMYHDQVLTPAKTLFNFNAINITLGLPFLRISPDHGPNWRMLGKNSSDPSSFFSIMQFVNKF